MKNVSQVIARIYAEALLDLAESTGEIGRIVDDLDAIRTIIEKDPRVFLFFRSPEVSPEDKKRILQEALGGKLHRATMGLLFVLIDKRRGALLDNIIDEFHRFRDTRAGRLHAHATTARPMSDDLRTQLVRRLEEVTNKTILLHEKVDPALLGGLIVKLGDRIIDGSLRRRLEQLRRDLVAARG